MCLWILFFALTAHADDAQVISTLDAALRADQGVVEWAAHHMALPDLRLFAEQLVFDNTLQTKQLEALAKRLKVKIAPTPEGDVFKKSGSESLQVLPKVKKSLLDQQFLNREAQFTLYLQQQIDKALLPACSAPDLRQWLEHHRKLVTTHYEAAEHLYNGR
jgi:predicted outer membrane protein